MHNSFTWSQRFLCRMLFLFKAFFILNLVASASGYGHVVRSERWHITWALRLADIYRPRTICVTWHHIKNVHPLIISDYRGGTSANSLSNEGRYAFIVNRQLNYYWCTRHERAFLGIAPWFCGHGDSLTEENIIPISVVFCARLFIVALRTLVASVLTNRRSLLCTSSFGCDIFAVDGITLFP